MTSWRMGPIRIGLSGEPGGGREMAFQLRREDTISFTVYEHYRPSGERLGPAVETVSKKIKVGDLFDSLREGAGLKSSLSGGYIRGLIREEVQKALFCSPGFDVEWLGRLVEEAVTRKIEEVFPREGGEKPCPEPVEGPIEKIKGIEIVGPKSPRPEGISREAGAEETVITVGMGQDIVISWLNTRIIFPSEGGICIGDEDIPERGFRGSETAFWEALNG